MDSPGCRLLPTSPAPTIRRLADNEVEAESGGPANEATRDATLAGGSRQIPRPDSSRKPPGHNGESASLNWNYTVGPDRRESATASSIIGCTSIQSGRSAAW